jgi:hypothetical protein
MLKQVQHDILIFEMVSGKFIWPNFRVISVKFTQIILSGEDNFSR